MSERRVPWVAFGSLVFLILAPGSVAGLIPFWLTGWRVDERFPVPSIGRVVGVSLIFVGLGSLLDSFARFVVVGLGTPAPIVPPTRLVVSGQYQHVRNPMYVAVLVIVLGQSLVLGSGILLEYAALLWFLFHLFVTLYEEPTLGSQFGTSYQVYRQNVRRWLPRVRPWDSERASE